MIQRNIDRAPPGGRGFHRRLRRQSRTRHQVQDRGRTPDGQALPADQAHSSRDAAQRRRSGPAAAQQCIPTIDPDRSIVLYDVRNDPASLGQPPRRVDEGRIALGERDPVYWTDGEPDLNRHLVKGVLCRSLNGGKHSGVSGSIRSGRHPSHQSSGPSSNAHRSMRGRR